LGHPLSFYAVGVGVGEAAAPPPSGLAAGVLLGLIDEEGTGDCAAGPSILLPLTAGDDEGTVLVFGSIVGLGVAEADLSDTVGSLTIPGLGVMPGVDDGTDDGVDDGVVEGLAGAFEAAFFLSAISFKNSGWS
jgi:hypothetical protein